MIITIYDLFNNFVLCMPDISLKQVTYNLEFIETAWNFRRLVAKTIVITPLCSTALTVYPRCFK